MHYNPRTPRPFKWNFDAQRHEANERQSMTSKLPDVTALYRREKISTHLSREEKCNKRSPSILAINRPENSLLMPIPLPLPPQTPPSPHPSSPTPRCRRRSLADQTMTHQPEVASTGSCSSSRRWISLNSVSAAAAFCINCFWFISFNFNTFVTILTSDFRQISLYLFHLTINMNICFSWKDERMKLIDNETNFTDA